MLFHGHKNDVRPPAVAGSFYPREPKILRQTVSDLLSNAKGSHEGNIKGIIAPHAGYGYSGQVAAEAFCDLGRMQGQIHRIVLLGPAHFVHVAGIAVPKVSAFNTPLGDVPVDLEAVEKALKIANVFALNAPHEPEHALEVELPFLQVELGSIPIVPIVVGATEAENVAAVLDVLWDDTSLVVVSSDLSHYHDYDTARRLDKRTAEAIKQLDETKIGFEDACGSLALQGMLIKAKRRGYMINQLVLKNSGDTAGDRSCVVGYGAWHVIGS